MRKGLRFSEVETRMETLWVCWKEPRSIPDGQGRILSFLSPLQHEKLRKTVKERLISAGEEAPFVKEEARQTYLTLIAQIGTATMGDGQTFRKALTKGKDVSLWWFHKLSERDCEKDPTFRFITEIAVIQRVAARFRNTKLVLVGGDAEIAETLGQIYETEEIACRPYYSFPMTYIWSVGARIRYGLRFLSRLRTIKKMAVPERHIDVALSGFWDWSVREEKGRLSDRYFGSLPEKLSARRLSVGWFLWFDPDGDPAQKGRPQASVLQPAAGRPEIVILQRFLKASDLARVLVDFRPFFIFRRFSRSSGFATACTARGIDYEVLLRRPIALGFLDATIPIMQLVRRASEKAFEQYRPTAAVSFLEFLLHSRAFYAGGRAGSPETIQSAVQHASYSREKTFGFLEPEREYRGTPDGYPMPKPDYLFAMGELGKEIFMENGFPETRVFLTGSSRYEQLSTAPVRKAKQDNLLHLLLVTSLDRKLEMEMVEAAYLATEEMARVRLLLRSHPFGRIEELPEFNYFSNRVTVTKGTLEEDLEDTDLILFSYSTVAEEAFVRGIPVWQWTSVNFNGSAFRDLGIIPSFSSPVALRSALFRFLDNPSSFMPGEESKARVLRKCFFKADGGASGRIADALSEFVQDQRAGGSPRPSFGTVHSVPSVGA